MRLLIIGTHPSQTTGYSKVVYNICKQLENYPDIRCTVYGIQKFHSVNDSERLTFSKNVSVWDVYQNDKEDFGFGTSGLGKFILVNDPDVILIYNDAEVVKKYIMNINMIKNTVESPNMLRDFKIVVYLDQVHKTHDKNTIKYISENSSHVFCFTDRWRENYLSYLDDSFKEKTSVIRHGVDSPEKLKNIYNNIECKTKLGFDKDSFIFLNLNRYAFKKHLDISIIAFVKFLKKSCATNAYMYFPAITEKSEGLQYIYDYEVKNNELNGCKDKLVINTNPLSDDNINMIYSACDIGLNSCDGEGFGLCNYEHASFGKPQILSRVGGLTDYFNDNNSLLCDPKFSIYDNMYRCDIIDSNDMADKMFKYYTTRSLYNKHSNIVKQISCKYRWDDEINKMMEVLLKL